MNAIRAKRDLQHGLRCQIAKLALASSRGVQHAAVNQRRAQERDRVRSQVRSVVEAWWVIGISPASSLRVVANPGV